MKKYFLSNLILAFLSGVAIGQARCQDSLRLGKRCHSCNSGNIAGENVTPAFGTYVDGLFGIGSDRPYEWGVGVGLRYNY